MDEKKLGLGRREALDKRRERERGMSDRFEVTSKGIHKEKHYKSRNNTLRVNQESLLYSLTVPSRYT